MTAVSNDYTRLGENLKRVYGGKIQNLVPDNIREFLTAFKFVPEQLREGDRYTEAVNLAVEQGFLLTTGTAGVADLADPSAGIVKQAYADASQIIGQAWLPYDMAAKALKSDSPQAFERATSRVMENLMLGHRRRQAINFLYGGKSIGTVSGAPSGAVCTISDASWAPGIWVGAKGMLVEIWSAVGGTQRSAVTSVVSCNLNSKTVTFNSGTSVADGDLIFAKGALDGSGNVQEAPGLAGILDEATTLFGIPLSSYPDFKGNSVSVGGPMTFDVIDNACTYPLNRGYEGALTAYLSPRSFKALKHDLQTSVHKPDYDKSVTVGAENIKFRSVCGMVDTKVSPWIKDGEAFVVADNTFKRIGTHDIKMGGPLDGSNFLVEIPSKSGYSIRSFSLQCLFTSEPGYSVHLTGITAS